ncbi:hypothetical protein E3N88_21567 [Mikania micrantha]|uniref:Uncharacterized protein n=1 Tax=Mikania micrantha TaxID=192012 RepID=A0A5N6N7V9_9ASTR|nr:hypothetical protein E3N88_21567 [Mikania micrantha]
MSSQTKSIEVVRADRHGSSLKFTCVKENEMVKLEISDREIFEGNEDDVFVVVDEGPSPVGRCDGGSLWVKLERVKRVKGWRGMRILVLGTEGDKVLFVTKITHDFAAEGNQDNVVNDVVCYPTRFESFDSLTYDYDDAFEAVRSISDMVVGNMTIVYLTVIAAIKGYGYLTGRCYGGAAVLVLSTAVVGLVLVAALTWDVSRKVVTCAMVTRRDDDVAHEMCRGGICWHGVAVKSPASQVRFRLPQRHAMNR